MRYVTAVSLLAATSLLVLGADKTAPAKTDSANVEQT